MNGYLKEYVVTDTNRMKVSLPRKTIFKVMCNY